MNETYKPSVCVRGYNTCGAGARTITNLNYNLSLLLFFKRAKSVRVRHVHLFFAPRKLLRYTL